MTTRFCLVFLFFFLAAFNKSFGQFEEEFTTGIRMGANYSGITGIRSTTLTGDTSFTATYKEEARLGYVGGLFFNYKLTDRSPYFAFQGEVDYSMHGAKFSYDRPPEINNMGEVTKEGFNYDVAFRYNYLTFGGLFKYYPLNNGLNVGIGPRLAFNISKNNIFYNSNTPFNDLGRQQTYRSTLSGQLDFGVMLGAGYEFPFGTTIDARYIIGVTDAIETGPNSIFWLETENNTRAFQLTVGHKIPFFRE